MERMRFLPDDLRVDANLGTLAGRTSTQRDFLETGSAGTNATCPPMPIGGTPIFISVIKIDTEDRRSSSLTLGLTAAILSTTPAFAGVQNINLVARLKWGVCGAFGDVEVDFINGFNIGISCSSLQVEIGSRAAVGTVSVGAFVSKSASGTRTEPRFTSEIPNLGALGSADIAIPAYASSFQLLRNELVGSVTIFYFNGLGLLMIAETTPAGTRHSQIDLPRDIARIQVVNNSAVSGLDNARGIFSLAI
jgi:hypothetical protein